MSRCFFAVVSNVMGSVFRQLSEHYARVLARTKALFVAL